MNNNFFLRSSCMHCYLISVCAYGHLVVCVCRMSIRHCGNCGISDLTLYSCACCKRAFYCGYRCQRAAWGAHKDVCLPELISTADDDRHGGNVDVAGGGAGGAAGGAVGATPAYMLYARPSPGMVASLTCIPCSVRSTTGKFRRISPESFEQHTQGNYHALSLFMCDLPVESATEPMQEIEEEMQDVEEEHKSRARNAIERLVDGARADMAAIVANRRREHVSDFCGPCTNEDCQDSQVYPHCMCECPRS